VGRQVGRLTTENQHVAGAKTSAGDMRATLGSQRKPLRARRQLHQLSAAARPVAMHADRGEFGIVHARTPQPVLAELEAERLYQMQPSAGVGAEPDDVAGVRRDFRVNQDDLEHR